MLCRSAWEIHFKRFDEVGANMAEFAMRSLSTMARTNPQISLHGALVPHLGSHLIVRWQHVIPLCAVIAGVHFVLFVSAVLATRGVVVKDDSNLSTARLLRHLVGTLGSKGTLMKGKQMSDHIQQSGIGSVTYGPRQVEGSSKYVLSISKHIKPKRMWKTGRHPNGQYL